VIDVPTEPRVRRQDGEVVDVAHGDALRSG
jgi:hypothetical protein